jgi:para-aminobenzoate synthetase component 1
VLELRDPKHAFTRIEEHLLGHGFGTPAAAGLRADLYLGYGLSEAIRRGSHPPPPEPCPLPLAACGVEPAGERRPAAGPCRIGRWRATWDPAGYGAAVEEVRAAIGRGDVYQVNLVQHLSAPFAGDVQALADRLAPLAPRYPSPLGGDGWAIVSASPELFLARRGDRLWTMPIKGTRPAGSDDGLVEAEKDGAEHVMIVDLERNDLSRACRPGTVRWPELKVARRLAGVTHLVSTVEGTLREEVGLATILAATFPGGSVTGAPKIAAIDEIARLEPVGRGASMGALGTVWPNWDFDLTLTIRTFAIADGRIHLWVGGGVVWDSDPAAEIEESWVKARPLLALLGSAVAEAVPA